MDLEMKNFIKVWISAIASLTYCYLISLNIPKGKIRLLFFLPIICFFTLLPMHLTTVSLGGCTAFFLTWLANSKLLLLAFGQGPLYSTPPISLTHFISIGCLPIKIKKNKDTTPSPENHFKGTKLPLNFAAKSLVLALFTAAYDYKQLLHPKLILVYYSCYMYVALELLLTMVGGMAATLIGVELEPCFNEPYLSTSLQDFWGRRWNLTASNMLRPTVYEPIKLVSTKALGRKGAQLLATFSTFVVSGLMHELVFYYLGRASPTWEVTMFFVLHGGCLATEIWAKKALKGRWRLHRAASTMLTDSFVMVTSFWLFFPPLLRCNGDVRAMTEVSALLNFIKDKGSVPLMYLVHKI